MRVPVVPEDGIGKKKFLRPIPIDPRFPVKSKRESGNSDECDAGKPDGDASYDPRFTLFIGIGLLDSDFRVVVNETVVTSGSCQSCNNVKN